MAWRWRRDMGGGDRLSPMMSNEHGGPDWATGAQGAEDLADGVSRNGSRGGYSALDGGPAAHSGDGAAHQVPPGVTGRHGRHGRPDEAEMPGYPASDPVPGEPAPDWSGQPEADGPDQPEPGDTAAAPDATAEQPATARKRRMSTWRELPILIVVALTIALVIKTFIVQPFYIPSSSMENTLMIGDKVLVNKLVYDFRSIKPGDVIVFNGDGSWNQNPPPSQPASNPFVRAYDATLRPLFSSIGGLFGTPLGQTDYVKRVIGTPGDRVACCNAQGLVTVNGVPLHEQSYLMPGAAPSAIHFSVVVPPGRLWVMGDNRGVSDDSRLRQLDPGHGTIPENKVIGRAFVVVWPPSHWSILSIPSTFSQPGISAASSAAGRTARAAAAAQLLGARVQPGRSYAPLAAGLVVAMPLTWLQRRARRRISERLRRRRDDRHS